MKITNVNTYALRQQQLLNNTLSLKQEKGIEAYKTTTSEHLNITIQEQPNKIIIKETNDEIKKEGNKK